MNSSNHNPETKFVATYGSLREGMYNNERFKNYFPKGFEYRFTSTIPGYKLYDLGAYPGIKKTLDTESLLVVDVMECSNECFQNINIMEIGANYTVENIQVEGIDCVIYLYLGGIRDNMLVDSGDWCAKNKLVPENEAILN